MENKEIAKRLERVIAVLETLPTGEWRELENAANAERRAAHAARIDADAEAFLAREALPWYRRIF